MRSTLLGVLQTLGIVAAFVSAGIAAGALYPSPMAPPEPSESSRPARCASAGSPDPSAASECWLVDGYNVIQVALLAGRPRERWWSEARRAELLDRADALAARTGRHVEVVFDGAEPGPAREGAHVVFAPCADDWILARVAEVAGLAEVAEASSPAPIVVSADRRLAARARRRGARVVAPAEFLARVAEEGAPGERAGPPEPGD